MKRKWTLPNIFAVALTSSLLLPLSLSAEENPALKKDANSFMPIKITKAFEEILEKGSADKSKFNQRQLDLLQSRYDLSDNPSETMMSGKRKPVQQGVRALLPEDVSWKQLAEMTPDQMKEEDLFPMGFRPLPHSKHETGGMVFPKEQIEAIMKAEHRDLERFDTTFDLPKHLTPEFPPPIFLTTHPELGDVSNGEVLTIKNYFRLMNGKLTPVQIEGLRLLLTPFPQQQFNQTDDRKVKEAQLGVTCLDCHVNGHTNATFHLNPDTRPQTNRFRIDTVSLRGMFNQQIHGSKRSLRSVEDFTEFEQRTAYFDGDHITAAKKGVHLPDRSDSVSMMAQMQNMFDFPPAPKLDLYGKLIPEEATEQELAGEKLFMGKARCAECHPAPFFLDNQMHDLKLERFYRAQSINGQYNISDGPIKTFTLRGIKDSPPYLHDGRLLTLDDTVEFFNIVQQLKLTSEEKADLVAYMKCL
ncbi:cytochrome B6 [Rubinisphaera sp.]|uniref:cytochrome B6 n=1 Tax=Rubinisphaera sp. TaxID=2024857 RepID=UPI000C105424|nr:cytochrome B6 [Rubinisphaera sp.]MBV10684.1 cytochrome B6 [Rubinisphaera sp.]HCS52423.1 cytochrome B6 [Planctomycetaceae bacterium]|tara:strand:+ start:11832 stop:13244 length:1413 start_codon:yes stop_codon:yes gene_type:complete